MPRARAASRRRLARVHDQVRLPPPEAGSGGERLGGELDLPAGAVPADGTKPRPRHHALDAGGDGSRQERLVELGRGML